MKKIDKTKTFLDAIVFCIVSDFQNNGKTEIFHKGNMEGFTEVKR